MSLVHASIVVIGDEILGGFVQDTNSGWLAQRLQRSGIPLQRVVTVPDTTEVIAHTLAEELARERPRVVFTSGGIGSTPDDLTMAAVARCLDVDLVPEPTIDAHITRALEWHTAQGVDVSPEQAGAMRKMALVPAGAYLLPGGGDTFPGIAIDVDEGLDGGGAAVVVLPGVPSLLQRITVEGVEPLLLDGRGRPQHVVEIGHSYPESMVNPVLTRLGKDFPDVQVGSYPGRECLIRLRGERDRVEEAAVTVRTFLTQLGQSPGASRLQEAWRQRWSGGLT